MNNKDFKIWLAKNDHNQKSLAAALGVSLNTITNYKKRSEFPRMFQLALKGLENEK